MTINVDHTVIAMAGAMFFAIAAMFLSEWATYRDEEKKEKNKH